MMLQNDGAIKSKMAEVEPLRRATSLGRAGLGVACGVHPAISSAGRLAHAATHQPGRNV